MNFNITYDSTVTSQSAAFQALFMGAANAAVQFYQHAFTTNITVNITFRWAPLSGNAIASNSFSLQGYDSYAQVKSALASHEKSADDVTSVGTLPASNPGNSTNGYVLTGPQARALGFAANFSVDDTVTLNSNLNYNWDPNNRGPGNTLFDAIGVFEHEISEGVFGRFQDLNLDGFNTALDLFRFTSAGNGTRTFGTSTDGWFSIDGIHNLERYNNLSVQTSDLADWYPTIQGDSYGNGYPGVASLVTPTDLRVLDILGWDRRPATVDDFNGDAVSDVLFWNQSTGDVGFYGMQGSFQGWHAIAGSSTAYSVVGTGDFNGDYATDVLFRNNVTGDVGFYAVSNGGNGTNSGNTPGDDLAGTFAGWHDIAGSSTAYSVVGVGDFNHDGISDILFRNNSAGDIGFYQMNSNGALQGWHAIAGSSTAYSVVGVGDFNGDGVSDVLFYNNSTGDTGFYQMNSNGTFQGWHDIVGSSTAYSVAGVGDFNGDGISDVLFRNNASGDTGFYQLNSNGTLQGWHDLGMTPTSYSVVGAGDYYGNGTSDVLFRNNATGDTGFYAVSNSAFTAWHDINGSSTAYHVVA